MRTRSINSITYLFATLIFIHICHSESQSPISFGDVALPQDSVTVSTFLTMYYQFNSDNTITIAVVCNIPNQYFSVGFGSRMIGSDMWVFEIVNSQVIATDYIGLKTGRPTLDKSNGGQDSLQNLGYQITSTYTLVKVKRLLSTGDSSDAIIKPGVTKMIYATGSSQIMVRHTKAQRGSTSVTLKDNTPKNVVITSTDNQSTGGSTQSSNSTIVTPTESTPESTSSTESKTVDSSGNLDGPSNETTTTTTIGDSKSTKNGDTTTSGNLDKTSTGTTGSPNEFIESNSGAGSWGDISLPTNSFSLGDFLTINYEFESNGFITMAIKCGIPNQYFSIGLGSSMFDSDIWVFQIVNSEVIVGDYVSSDEVPPSEDTENGGQNDIQRLGYEITPTYTLVKIRRALDTNDVVNDKVVRPGMNDMIYATASSTSMQEHTEMQRGSATVSLIGNPQDPTGQLIQYPATKGPSITDAIGDVALPANSFTLGDFLTVNYEFEGNNSIMMTIKCNLSNQYFSIGLGSSMFDSDIWVFEIINSEVTVGDYVSTDEVRPKRDIDNAGKNDLERLGYEITQTYTIVKVRRALNTNDPNDKVIQPGMTDIIYATASAPNMREHTEMQRGSTTIFFMKNSDSSSVQSLEPVATRGSIGDTSLPSSYFRIGNLLNVYFEFNSDNSITIAMKCNTPSQYFGIGFGHVMLGSDMWVFEIVNNEVTVTDYIGLIEGRPTKDITNGGKEDLERLAYEITPDYTMVKVKRALNTGDPNDAIISQGWVEMMYATASSKLMMKHRTAERGSVRVPLIEGIQGYTSIDDSSNFNEIHGILNIVAWGFLVDIGIIAVRFMRGMKITLGKINISAQLIHSVIMWFTLIMSTTVSTLLLKQNRSLRGPALSGDGVTDFHFINGLVMMFLSIMMILTGVLNMQFMKSLKKPSSIKINLKTIHKVLGYFMYLMTKVNIITGTIIHEDGIWKVPVFIYLGIFFILIVVIRMKDVAWFKYLSKITSINQKPSVKSKHSALLSAINKGLPTEKILPMFPNIKWVQLGNKIYDLTSWTHPGGNFLIKSIIGREVGRYLYGNYALEGIRMKPHKHSALSLSQIESFCVGEATNCESILISKNITDAHEVISSCSERWTLSSIIKVSDTVSQINFNNKDFKVKNFGTSLSWLGRHFKVSTANSKSPARIYTSALSLNAANTNLRKSICKYFDQVMVNDSFSFSYDPDYLKPQNDLPLFIKNYSGANGLSKKLHRINIKSRANNFKIEGPISRGLELSLADRGTQAIICAGTGVLPFIDFLNFFLWKNIYELIKTKVGVEKAREINVLNIPFEEYMNDLKINFFGAFANEREVLGLDIIEKLAEISNVYGTQNFNAMMKGFSSHHIREVKGTFSHEFLKKHISLSEDRIYVVGPPKMNSDVQKALIEMGYPKEKIIFV